MDSMDGSVFRKRGWGTARPSSCTNAAIGGAAARAKQPGVQPRPMSGVRATSVPSRRQRGKGTPLKMRPAKSIYGRGHCCWTHVLLQRSQVQRRTRLPGLDGHSPCRAHSGQALAPVHAVPAKKERFGREPSLATHRCAVFLLVSCWPASSLSAGAVPLGLEWRSCMR